jgi:hypothetical protein
MEQMRSFNPRDAVQKASAFGMNVARNIRKILVGTIAVIAMMIAYGVTTVGSMGATALGIAGVTSVATLTAASTPAHAYRYRRRRRARRRYRRRRRGGWYWGWY